MQTIYPNSKDIHNEERAQAVKRLMEELDKGRRSGEEKGWLTLEAVEASLGVHGEAHHTVLP